MGGISLEIVLRGRDFSVEKFSVSGFSTGGFYEGGIIRRGIFQEEFSVEEVSGVKSFANQKLKILFLNHGPKSRFFIYDLTES